VGGFGIVYRGTDVHFGETVAIKEYFPGAISDRVDGTTVTPTDSSSEEIYQLGRQKFMEEAKVLWGLSHPERHPNIVAVRSLFEIHGTAYMVMDFESGVSLSQMLHDGRKFDEASLLAIVRPVAEGLDRAHRAGVLHRDIKPANILMSRDGRPVLIDFGSARFESSQATNTKVTFYTPPYAALEQYVKSYPQGPWTDIYALGVVLYQCVTGEKPPEVLERLHGEDGSLLSSRDWPGFSRVFTRAVDAAMAVRPLERPQSISSWLKLFDATEPVSSDEVTRIAVSPPKPSAAAATSSAGPKAQSAPRPAVAAKAKSAASAKRGSIIVPVALGFVAVFALLATASLIINRMHKVVPALPATAPAEAVQAADSGPALTDKMQGLIEAAQKANLKPNEVASLSNTKLKLASLVANKAPPADLAATATDMAKTENENLGRTERRMWRDLGTLPDSNDASGGANTLANLKNAKAALDSALAAPIPQDGAQIIDQTRALLSTFAAFQDAYKMETPAVVAARHKAFDALQSATQSLCDQVTALANVEKPWFLASAARKNAYKLRQDNAALAKSLSQRLDGLGKSVAASSDLRELTSAISQATDDQTKANQLYASSSAAAL
jgi:serine/threonine protein kinase